MAFLLHMSRQKLEVAIYNSFFQKPICISSPFVDQSGGTVWVSRLTLNKVDVVSGTSASDMKKVDIYGVVNSGAATTIKKTFSFPGLFALLHYELVLIKDKDILAGDLQKESVHQVVIRMNLTGGLGVIGLSYESITPSDLPGIPGADLDLILSHYSPFDTLTCFSLHTLEVRSNLHSVNSATRLSTDQDALVTRCDYEFPKATAMANGSFEIPVWKTFFDSTLPSQLGGADMFTSHDASILKSDILGRATDYSKTIQDFSVDSVTASWGVFIEALPKQAGGSTTLHQYISGLQSSTIEGEVEDACLWIDVNYFVEMKEIFRLLESWEKNYSPGRIFLTRSFRSNTTGLGSFEVLICRTIQVLVTFGGAALGGLAFSWLGAIAGAVGSGLLIDKATKHDDWSVSGTTKWYIDLVYQTVLGETVATDMTPSPDGLAMRYRGNIKVHTGTPKISIHNDTDWVHPHNPCALLPRDTARNTVTIKNEGTATLRICNITLVGADTEHVFRLIANAGYWISPGQSEVIVIQADVNDQYESNPYGMKLRLITNIGPQIIDVGIARRISKTDYEVLRKGFAIDRDCLNLEMWPDRPWSRKLIDMFGPLYDPPRDGKRPEIIHYELFFRNLGNSRKVLVETTDKTDRGEFFPFDGNIRSFIASSPEAMESSLVKLSGDSSDRKGQKANLTMYRGDWHLEDSWNSPAALGKMDMLHGRVLALAKERLIVLNANNPLSLQPDWLWLEGSVLDFTVCRSRLFLLRPKTIEVYSKDFNNMVEAKNSFPHEGFHRIALSGDLIIGTAVDKVVVMKWTPEGQASVIAEAPLVGALDAFVAGDSIVIHTREGLSLHNRSGDRWQEPMDTWGDDSIERVQRIGRMVAAFSKMGLKLFSTIDQKFQELARYKADPRPLQAKRRGNYAFAIRQDGRAIESFRVYERFCAGHIHDDDDRRREGSSKRCRHL